MKILLIQIRQLGDILLSSTLAKVIKEDLKGEVEVHFLTSFVGQEILAGNPFIDRVLTIGGGIREELQTIFAVRRENYDAVIDVQRTGRSKRITLFSGASVRVAFKRDKDNFYYNRLIEWKNHGYTVWDRMELLKGIGIKSPVKKYLPEFYAVKGTKRVEGLIPEGKFVVLVPTARRKEKMWCLEKYAKLIEFLKEDLNIHSVVCYAPGERKYIEDLKKLIKVPFHYPQESLSIGELAFLVKSSILFIGNNSFASHLAVSLGVKTIVVDKKKSGWFPPVSFVKEISSNGRFPDLEAVKEAVRELVL